MTQSFPEAALRQHTAILGKTGSGKTSTAKLAIEQVVAAGARVCILDPIKSDWWGLTSSADGRHPGLDFSILGGPRGHVALHSSAGEAIAELVASGELPRSIIDMADFEPGGLQRFFIDFAPTLLRKMRGVLYLVIEEAHEFAPKEKSGVGGENMATHYAKKLATAGRSKGIRLIVATQRTQSLHNAMLGSCETMIVHRMTAPADQEPVLKWLKGNAPKEVTAEVGGSIASLPTGTGWVCSGEAGLFMRQPFPRIATYDNSATPTETSGNHNVTTAAVDHERLRLLIGDAVREADANDPKRLRDEIKGLRAQLDASGKAPKPDAASLEQVSALQKRVQEAESIGRDREERRWKLEGLILDLIEDFNKLKEAEGVSKPALADARTAIDSQRLEPAARLPAPRPPAQPRAKASGSPQQRILDALAWWEAFGIDMPTNEQVAFIANYSPNSTSYTNPRGELKKVDLIDYPSSGCVCLTDNGRDKAAMVGGAVNKAVLHQRVISKLSGPQERIFQPLLNVYPKALSNGELAGLANYSAGSTSYTNPRGDLKALSLIEYPSSGMVRACAWLFP